MSIFDVIRYPISNPVKLEELEILPRKLFVTWLDNAGWYSPEERIPTKNFVKMLNRSYYRDVELLKMLIKEYDEPL